MLLALPILAYCMASIMMTVVNSELAASDGVTSRLMRPEFVVSGSQFTMTFLRELASAA
jgi:hypothetical protein